MKRSALQKVKLQSQISASILALSRNFTMLIYGLSRSSSIILMKNYWKEV